MVDVASLQFCGATLDSRQVKPGMLFVAMKGERVDGHDFIPQALAAGAAGVIDGPDELASAARAWRASLSAKVVGVTGSAGKTTTKELIAAFLRSGGHKVHATAGNYNNDLGLPLTILNCPRDADFLVLEMGTNHPGEIRHLVEIARPFAGAISSIGTAHIEFFKTQDGIADEKGELFRALPPDGFAVLSSDNARHSRLAAMSAAPVVTVSPDGPDAERLASALAVRLPGRHNVTNALIAAACAGRFGVSLEKCLEALRDFTLPGGRWRVVESGGATYIDDTYNANPTSMIAALETFASLPVAGRRIAVLGDMFELGERSAEFHAAVGRRARELLLDMIVTVGAEANAHIAGDVRCESAAEARDALAGLVRPGDAVILKASHGMHLADALDFIPPAAPNP